MTEERTPYPVRVDASLDPGLSRGLWLVKWLLLIPHYVVLVFLWLAFFVVSVIAFVAILVSGRYPRALFDFNVGVLRWSWRVHYYGYGALGTDRYPPFSLADVPDYPAHLDVPYPGRLSRGLVLVKWWLLALPHYLVVGIFAGGGLWFTGRSGGDGSGNDGWAAGGLIGLLVLIAGIVLLVRGRYPRSLYDFVLGMDRWVLRVAAYAGLMTDSYPPFRLDMGGTDPGPVRPGPLPGTPGGPAAAVPAGADTSAAPHTGAPAHRWTGGRVVALVLGALVVLPSTGLLTAGVGLHWADQTQREGEWLTSDDESVSTAGYALVTDDISLDAAGAEWIVDNLIGEVRLEMTAADPDVELFAGIAPTRAVRDYLAGVERSRLGTVGPGYGVVGPDGLTDVAGGPPAQPPTEQDFWVAQAAGSGTQTLQWTPTAGDWTVVVMRADGSAGVDTSLAVAATVPGLAAVAWGLLGAGALLLAVGGLIIALALRQARSPGPPPATTWTPPAPVDGGPGSTAAPATPDERSISTR
ncbi:protein of unknown function [Blastococcus aggregatus]|uniref:DUF4389 domain-containing protein n=1 Tax=Blastococcus aggregatus TaxID=38502 RepID=A0A285V7S8_9ACTN|nr:DUF4389 domain-containing protein [Blastococcus aggregatus]SOC49628.1 protein of unknown function [Blastococcus aggregatus]